ncbi:C2H2 finger domain-containing protein [Coccidioides immitis RS]|uniref:C2H2 finger domain-containing protein n=3 Tax=Coccidioides immitis TaxID=5501 RepID=A0A0E1RZ25_COCIM|nr:C2H2 finger domain-containing protein [Coccidioides immitis RS]EAS36817.1 C2H2 finger domain-containing protein [Coccidioides immitis RS]KMP09717.1 zinc finger domain containing protein [Coccidioides immitis RMSCC 2394]
MLELEFPPQPYPYSQDLSMDPMISCISSSAKGDEQTSVGAYTSLLSETYPFFIHPSFASGSQQPIPKSQPYPNPSASPSIATSQPELLSSCSSISTHSFSSAPSSSIGSPHRDTWPDMNPGSGFEENATVSDRGYAQDYLSNTIDADVLISHAKISDCFVDPSLIQPTQDPNNYQLPVISYPEDLQLCFVTSPTLGHQPSPQLHHDTQKQFQQRHEQQQRREPNFPISTTQRSLPQENKALTRRSSISSVRSRPSVPSPQLSHIGVEDEGKEKGRCPHPNCGKTFKDLKAHMLTHQSERPEKCPIVNCEYHLKGFARKYDKNRHTLTHYKGTMVCGFCPGSGSAAEKSFNRADVFKRHLTSVHGVDQSAPNSRKRTPPNSVRNPSGYCQDATGKCSTCTATFSNAQEFYEHLDDCVLRVVQQEEPSEAINMRRLAEVESDEAVKQTMKKHMLVSSTNGNSNFASDNDKEDNKRDGFSLEPGSSKGPTRSNIVNRFLPPNSGAISKSRPSVARRRNNRNNYPPSWGCPANKMKMKRRLLCLYDGPRRLWKDEMMLDNEFEVRLNLPGGDGMGREAYVTDLDVETLKRAEGVLNATQEEKGPWDSASAGRGLIGPAAVPILGNTNDIVDEINIDELMS